MVIRESTSSEISSYLRSKELYDEIKDLTDDSFETCRTIFDICTDKFENIVLPKVTRVQVLKVDDEEYSILESDYYVIEYNGRFYDYCVYTNFSDIFKVQEYNMPVIQPILTLPNLIHSTVSTLKNYVIIKYGREL